MAFFIFFCLCIKLNITILLFLLLWLLNVNYLIMQFNVVFIFVCFEIIVFMFYYMSNSLSFLIFQLFYLFFLFFMIIMVDFNNWYLLIVGWEMMGVMSFLLISWFNGRQLARNGAFLAFNINRLGDLFLFFGILFGFTFFIVLSLLTKSSMWIFSTWLPNAMEGPTPVSALLHSSTMVVAGVFLVQFFNFLSFHIVLFLLLYGTYMGLLGYKFGDYK